MKINFDNTLSMPAQLTPFLQQLQSGFKSREMGRSM
jgi:hypothetical protein